MNIIRGDRRSGVARPITNVDRRLDVFRKPVDNIGNKSIPQYAPTRTTTSTTSSSPDATTGACSSDSGRTPFVVNLGETFDLVNITNPLGAENAEADDLADKNVTSFVLEVPIACLVQSATADHRWLDDGQPRCRHAGGHAGGPTPCPAGHARGSRPTEVRG